MIRAQLQRRREFYLHPVSLLADLKLDTPDRSMTAMCRNGSGHASPGIGRDLDVMWAKEELRRTIRQISSRTVSYTHLTLPTILLV